MSRGNGGSFRARGRQLWFQIHKWIGLALLVVLIPLSASGSLLVWHDWTDTIANPHRYDVNGKAVLPVSDYASGARAGLGSEYRLASITLPAEADRPVVVGAVKAHAAGGKERTGPPQRAQVWLDPADGRVLDRAEGNADLVRFLHQFHGSLMVPGWGRPIVGWLGVAMLISALTGLWLWLPVTGSLRRGFRWRRGPSLSARLHHQIGFWIALPLAILSFTGAYISFPTAMRSVEGLFVSPPARGGPVGPTRAPPLAVTRLGPDAAVTAALAEAGGGKPLGLRWPTEQGAIWTVTVGGAAGRRDISVDDAAGTAKPAKPPAGGVARFMRTLHDGNGYNPVWQTLIFLGGLAPTALGITGLLMWLRARKAKRRFVTLAPAE